MKARDPSIEKGPPGLRLRVKPAAETIIRSGHPWLYADSLREQNRPGTTGELAVIYDRNDRFLAVGLFDADSPIRVRVLHTGKPRAVDREFWLERLNTSLELRRKLFDDQTTGYRCLNGENDGWPGLVLDRFAETYVLKLYSLAWLPRLNEVIELLRSGLRPKRLVLRLSRNIQAATAERFSREDGSVVVGEPMDGPVVFLENGLEFEADVLHGQKTGFFLDQRENRARVETFAGGRRVLNAFSFSGGFALYAARGGAKSVLNLDLSTHALAAAERNFALNRSIPAVAACRHQTAQAEAFEWLAGQPPRQFDLVVLDPPSLAMVEANRARAIRAYGRLAAAGIRQLADGGILVAASCSAHVSTEEFFEVVRRSATGSRRRWQELHTAQHAPDHPARIPELEYLKAIFLKLC